MLYVRISSSMIPGSSRFAQIYRVGPINVEQAHVMGFVPPQSIRLSVLRPTLTGFCVATIFYYRLNLANCALK